MRWGVNKSLYTADLNEVITLTRGKPVQGWTLVASERAVWVSHGISNVGKNGGDSDLEDAIVCSQLRTQIACSPMLATKTIRAQFAMVTTSCLKVLKKLRQVGQTFE